MSKIKVTKIAEMKDVKNYLEKQEQNIMNKIKQHQEDIEQLKQQLVETIDLRSQICESQSKPTEEVKTEEVDDILVEDFSEETKQRIIEYYYKQSLNIKQPQVTQEQIEQKFNISSQDLLTKYGGFDKLVRDSTEKYLQQILSEEAIKYIQNYQQKHNKMPARESLIKMSYVSRRTMDKIARISCSRKPLQIIEEYISKQPVIKRSPLEQTLLETLFSTFNG